jgi:hypothetical protein
MFEWYDQQIPSQNLAVAYMIRFDEFRQKKPLEKNVKYVHALSQYSDGDQVHELVSRRQKYVNFARN